MFTKNRRLPAFILAAAVVAIIASWLAWPATAPASRQTAGGRAERSVRTDHFGAWDDEFETIAGDESDAAPTVAAKPALERHNINQLYVIASPENGIAPLPELNRK